MFWPITLGINLYKGLSVANRKIIPSNVTGLSFCEEDTDGLIPSELTVPGTNVWYGAEPNTYRDFGAESELVARSPISRDRQRKKGTVVGVTASGGFESDLTATNLSRLLQGFMFADFRRKYDAVSTGVNAGGTLDVDVDASGILAGDLIFTSGAEIAANNGLFVATAGSDADTVALPGLVEEAAPINVTKVGFQFAAGDLTIDATAGENPRLIATAKDLTEIGLIPGEIIYIGGDSGATRFANPANNGWARVKSIDAGEIILDKTDFEMVDDAGAAKTIRLFCGRVLKNEVGDLIKSRTYRLERSMGAPDKAVPGAVQGEYLKGAVPNSIAFSIPERDKVTAALMFMAADYETRTAAQGLLPGTRPVLPEEDVYNSSGDAKRIRMAVYPKGILSSAPDPLFALVQGLEFTINNNATENTAVGYITAAQITEGDFEVTGSITAYFATVQAAQAIRDNADVTLDFALWKANRGIAVDFPMIALGGGRAGVTPNRPITLPLDTQMSTGAKYDPAFNHTLLFSFFDYLPTIAGQKLI